MSFLCNQGDRSIMKNPSEYNDYLSTRQKKYDKGFYKNYTVNNVNLNEVDKMFYNYITIHNTKFNFCLVKCDFLTEFDNNFTSNIETNYLHNIDDIITK